MSFVLDASAMLALLLNERGADVVADAVRDSEMLIVNHCEVMTKIVERGGDADKVHAIVLNYGARIVPFRQEHAFEAAQLRPLTRHLGLSLGDRACLAHGRYSGLPILTTDTDMAKAELGLDVRLIR